MHWIIGYARAKVALARFAARVAPFLFNQYLARSLERVAGTAALLGRPDLALEQGAEAVSIRRLRVTSRAGRRRLAAVQARHAGQLLNAGHAREAVALTSEADELAGPPRSRRDALARASIEYSKAVVARRAGRHDDVMTAARSIMEVLRPYRIPRNRIHRHVGLAHELISGVHQVREDKQAALDSLAEYVARLERLSWVHRLARAPAIVQAQLRQVELLLQVGRHADALDVAMRARSRAESADLLGNAGPVMHASCEFWVALAAESAGDYEAAAQTCVTAEDLYRGLLERDWEQHAESLVKVLWAHSRLRIALDSGDPVEPVRESVKLAGELARRQPREHSGLLLTVSRFLADQLYDRGDSAGAVDAMESAAREIRRALASVDGSGPLLRSCLRDVGVRLDRYGRTRAAAVLAEECVAISRAAGQRRETAIDLTRSARYADVNERALARATEAIEMLEAGRADEDHVLLLEAHATRSWLRVRSGEFDAAVSGAEKLIALAGSTDGDGAPSRYWLAEGLHVRCVSRHTSGDISGALADADRLIELISADESGVRQQLADWLSEKAWILAKLGRHYDAIVVLRELQRRTTACDSGDDARAALFNRALKVAPADILAAWRDATGEDWPVEITRELG